MDTLLILPLLTGIEIVVVAGIIVIVALLGFSAKNLIAVTSLDLSVPIDGTATLTVFLVRKGWFSSKLKPTSGTLTYFHSSLISITPASPVTINRANRSVVLTITGIVKGTGTITLNGKSRGGKRTHDTVVVNYTVA